MMSRLFWIPVVLLVGLPLAGCNGAVTPEDDLDPTPRPVVTVTAEEQQLIEAENAFGLKLFHELSRAEPEANLFISPLSVSMALGMTLNGAAGDTRADMQMTLELAGLSMDDVNASYRTLIDLFTTLDESVVFEIANSIWYRDSFAVEQTFLDLNTAYFDAAVRPLDFDGADAPGIINAWVDENTHGKIKKIIDGGIDPLTMMFLINAIYFKGDWTYPFDERLTQDDTFTRADGSTSPVRMMTMPEATFLYTQHRDFQAVDLPYGDSLFSMTIFLPRDGLPLADFVADLNTATWNQWTARLAPVKLDLLQMPTFKLEYDVSLKQALSTLGMDIAFDPSRADFSGINPAQGDLHISDVKHKTFIEVDEEGTEAAAVTSVVVGVTSVGEAPPITMRIDRPFVFAIREHATGSILFIGQITKL